MEPNEGKRKGPVKGETALQAALSKNEVMVMRAPKGMSRSKANRTRWLKGAKVLEWTVEWVHGDGRKELRQCKDDVTVMKAYESLESVKRESRKRKRGEVGMDALEEN